MMKKKATAKKYDGKRDRKRGENRSKRLATGKPERITIVLDSQDAVWIAVPGVKVLSPGDSVEWHALKAKSFTFTPDPNVFTNIKTNPANNKITADVISGTNAPVGYFACPMTVEDENGNQFDVEGGSSPAVIID